MEILVSCKKRIVGFVGKIFTYMFFYFLFSALRDLASYNGIEIKGHKYNANCLKFSQQNNAKFYSTSLDGTVRIGDINSSSLNLVRWKLLVGVVLFLVSCLWIYEILISMDLELVELHVCIYQDWDMIVNMEL